MNKLMNKVRKNKKGFTLIELIVVIAILGILVLLAAPRFLGYTKDAHKATMQADAKVLANAALVYNIENEGEWPVADGAKTIATFEQGGESFNVVEIDKTKLSDQAQSLKGEFSDYGIVIEGSRQGSVYHVGSKKDRLDGVDISKTAPVVDRKGDKHYGVDLVDVALDKDGNEFTADDVTVTNK